MARQQITRRQKNISRVIREQRTHTKEKIHIAKKKKKENLFHQ